MEIFEIVLRTDTQSVLIDFFFLPFFYGKMVHSFLNFWVRLLKGYDNWICREMLLLLDFIDRKMEWISCLVVACHKFIEKFDCPFAIHPSTLTSCSCNIEWKKCRYEPTEIQLQLKDIVNVTFFFAPRSTLKN